MGLFPGCVPCQLSQPAPSARDTAVHPPQDWKGAWDDLSPEASGPENRQNGLTAEQQTADGTFLPAPHLCMLAVASCEKMCGTLGGRGSPTWICRQAQKPHPLSHSPHRRRSLPTFRARFSCWRRSPSPWSQERLSGTDLRGWAVGWGCRMPQMGGACRHHLSLNSSSETLGVRRSLCAAIASNPIYNSEK